MVVANSRFATAAGGAYIAASALVLVTTGLAKLYSVGMDSELLGRLDPILEVSFRTVFLVTGGVELVLGIACALPIPQFSKFCFLTWFATSAAIYRLGLPLVDYHAPCKCIGTITDAIKVAPETAAMWAKVTIFVILAGGYALIGSSLIRNFLCQKVKS